MSNLIFVLLLITMAGVLGILGAGMLGVVKSNDPRRSNNLMRWRVMLQGLAVVLFILLLVTRQH